MPDPVLLAFEIINPTNGKKIRIYANGETEGLPVDGYCVIINHLPRYERGQRDLMMYDTSTDEVRPVCRADVANIYAMNGAYGKIRVAFKGWREKSMTDAEFEETIDKAHEWLLSERRKPNA